MQRFWDKVVKSEGCWEWSGSKTIAGYARFGFNGRSGYAHRYSYILHKGPTPSGLELDHLCRNRSCVNPNHLEAVTGRTNIFRSPRHIAVINAAKTHCPKGHEYAGKRNKKNGRYCNVCQRDIMRIRRKVL